MNSESEEEFDHEAQALLLEQLDKYASNLLGDEEVGQNKKKNKIKTKTIGSNENVNAKLKSPKTRADKCIKVNQNKMDVSKESSHAESLEKSDIKISSKITEIASSDTTEKSNQLEKRKKNKKKKKKEKSEEKETDVKKDMVEEVEEKKKHIKKVEFDVPDLPEFDDVSEDDNAGYGGDFMDDEFDEIDSSRDDLDNDELPVVKTNSSQRHLEDLKRSLGLTEKDFLNYKKEKEGSKHDSHKNSSHTNMISSKGGKKRPPPEVIVFEDPAKRTKKNALNKQNITNRKSPTKRTKNINVTDDNLEFDLISAKHEVHKFGVDGLDQSSKEEATVKMLMNLGAKPPKKTCINYKELMRQKKEEHEERKNTQVMDKHYLGPTSVGGNKKKQRRKPGGKNKSDFGDGQLGKYKHGVQFIKSDDIMKMKSTKSGKRTR